MSILVFLNAFWHKDQTVGGGDQTALQVLKRLESNFKRIVFVTNQAGERFAKRNLIQAEFISSPAWFDSLGVFLSYVLRTGYALMNLKLWQSYERIYVSSDFFPDVWPAFILKILKPKTKWIQHLHHLYLSYQARPGNRIKNLLAQKLQNFSLKLIRKSNAIMVTSQRLKNTLINQNAFKPEKIQVIANGIDIAYFSNLKPMDGAGYEATFLARLHPTKGVFDLIKIWQLVNQKIPLARLAVIGGAEEKIKKQVLAEIKKNNLQGKIELLGFLTNDEAFGLIKNSTVFIFPSHEEGFGRVIIEAMACGVPVVAWDLPVYLEIYGDYLVRVKEKDYQGFANKIIELIWDKEKKEALVKNGLEFVKKFDWKKLAQEYWRVLNI